MLENIYLLFFQGKHLVSSYSMTKKAKILWIDSLIMKWIYDGNLNYMNYIYDSVYLKYMIYAEFWAYQQNIDIAMNHHV